jgi:uncharacterized protein (TIGR03083 family)
MPRKVTADALIVEAAALSWVVAELDGTDLSRPSPCPPWTVGALICHVLIAADRIAQALAEPDGAAADNLISTAAYYRPDERFSAATNADRIATAQSLADRLVPAGPRALAAELDHRCAASAELLMAAPADRVVRTRHGDRMLLTDFARTRVVELGVHGLDVAIGLNRQWWLTDMAAGILEDLLLPAASPPQVRAALGCDRTGLIARLTGRIAISAADARRLADLGVARLALG